MTHLLNVPNDQVIVLQAAPEISAGVFRAWQGTDAPSVSNGRTRGPGVVTTACITATLTPLKGARPSEVPVQNCKSGRWVPPFCQLAYAASVLRLRRFTSLTEKSPIFSDGRAIELEGWTCSSYYCIAELVRIMLDLVLQNNIWLCVITTVPCFRYLLIITEK